METPKPLTFNGLVRADLKDYCKAANMKFNEHVRSLMAQGQQIYHFGFGQAPFPILEHMAEALKDSVTEATYLPVAGIPELRASIAEFHARHDGLVFNPDNIIVGPGSKELIYLAMMVFSGDVMVLSPSWTTYKPQAQLAHHDPVVIETNMADSWRLTPQVLEKALTGRSLSPYKLLIMCNPDNPTGTAYTAEDLKTLSDTLRKHQIIVISDEIYGRLRFDQNHISLAKFYPEGTVVSTGLSKWASAGGWRVGYHIYPAALRELQDAVHSAASHTYSTCSAPMQYAVTKALRNHEACASYIRHTSRVMAAVASFCHRELTSVGVMAVKPTAGYYIFPNFEIIRPALKRRGILTGDQMCSALFDEANIALMSGGPAYLRPLEEFTTRLCFVNFDGASALAESRRLGLDKPLPDEFVYNYCRPVYEGIKKLKAWVEKHLD